MLSVFFFDKKFNSKIGKIWKVLFSEWNLTVFFFPLFFGQFSKFSIIKLKKKTPPTYGAIESAFLVIIFFKLEKRSFGVF
jgi:hypothetical protein